MVLLIHLFFTFANFAQNTYSKKVILTILLFYIKDIQEFIFFLVGFMSKFTSLIHKVHSEFYTEIFIFHLFKTGYKCKLKQFVHYSIANFGIAFQFFSNQLVHQ